MASEPIISTISLKRYNEIKQVIYEKCNKEDAEFICQRICEIVKFNPDSKTKSQKVIEWRKKKAEELGVSTYKIMKGLNKLKTNE